MSIKGTDIVKKLPEGGKKNCRECGLPTCFAFAMKLASGGISLDKCPYLSPQVKAELAGALAPPINLVTIGHGENALQIGNEEVLYRHEKTFIHQPGIALLVSDEETEASIERKIKKISELRCDRVGLTLKADLLALYFESGDKSKFEALVRRAYEATGLGVVLISDDLDALFEARDIYASRKPLIYPITEENVDRAIPRIKQSPTPVGVRAETVEQLVPLTLKLKEAGIEEIVLDPGSRNLRETIAAQTLLRRAALKQKFRPLGYPTIAFPCFVAKGGLKEFVAASVFIIKYAGIIVISDADQYSLLPLLVQRLNIYTDPRMPLAVEEKVYEINEPNEQSPVLLTTNWSLTYFIVSSETEASKVPSWLCVKNSEGLGVVTAWAAGKFSADTIEPFIKRCGIEAKVNHRRLVIPGKVARIRGELEEAMSDWEVIVGPREASDIPAFLPELVKKWK